MFKRKINIMGVTVELMIMTQKIDAVIIRAMDSLPEMVTVKLYRDEWTIEKKEQIAYENG